MSKKPLFALLIACSLAAGAAQPAAAGAPRAYLCPAPAGCDCAGQIAWSSTSPANYDLCLRVGPQVSASAAADCSEDTGDGDELCGWEFEMIASAELTILSFEKNTGENLEVSSLPAPSLSLNWLFVDSPLPAGARQRLGSIQLTGDPDTIPPLSLRASAESRAVPAGGGEVSIDPGILFLMPEPSGSALLLSGIAALWVLSRRGRRVTRPLLAIALLFAAAPAPTRADPLNLLSPKSLLASPEFQGESLAAVGDVNGDRVVDLAIGRPDADGGRGEVTLQLMRRDGSVHSTLVIGEGKGGFGGSLVTNANFGAAIASPGDLDGDGLPELAVAAPGASQIWILFFDAAWSLKVENQVLISSPSITEPVHSLAALGDVDADGYGDLAAGHPLADTGCTTDCGAVSLLGLNGDGSLLNVVSLQNGTAGLSVLPDDMQFGASLAALGDLDDDGNPELAVGALGGGAGGNGSVEVLSLDATGAVVAQAVIDTDSPGFMGYGDVEIGRALAATGDLGGGSGLAVGSAGSAGVGEGRVALLVLGAPPGDVVASDSLDASSAPPDAVGANTNFGRALAALDVDADGDPELAVGALSDAAQTFSDPIWLLELRDTDDDQQPDFLDNCERFPNPLQSDGDGDGIGDFCDVCPQVADPDQLDDDGNGVGDDCEPTRVRLRPVDPFAQQRNQWALELECGASDVEQVLAVLTPIGADVDDFEFGDLAGNGCDETNCIGATQLGGTVNPANSRTLVTDTNGLSPSIGVTLIAESLYAFLEGNAPPSGNLLCSAGNSVSLGNLNWSPAVPDMASNPQVVLSLAQVEGLGPIQGASGLVENYRVECDECGDDPIPVTRTGSFFSSDGGGDEVHYTLSPLPGQDPAAVVDWEFCFAAPELLHRIAVSAEPLTGSPGAWSWLGCAGAAGTINPCEASGLQENSPYGSIYTTVDVGTPSVSFSYTPSGSERHYLLLDGSVPPQSIYSPTLSLAPHTSEFPEYPPITCVARLRTEAIDPATSGVPVLKALESEDMDVFTGIDCPTHPVLLGSTNPIPALGCDGSNLPLTTTSASTVPEDYDEDERRNEEDNCPFKANIDQSDLGGNGNEEDDGTGDLCQCGEANDNGAVQQSGGDDDVASLREHLARPDPGTAPAIEERCSVAGSGACTILDAVVLQRSLGPPPNFGGDFVANCAADRP